MLNITRTRDLYESRCKESRGRLRFVNDLKHTLGLCDAGGNPYRDRAGNRVLKESKISPEAFSLQELAEAIVGPSWRQVFNPQDKGSMAGYASHRLLLEGQYGDEAAKALLEAGPGIDVSAFANINAWTSVVGGLVEVKILEGYQNPSFIGDELCPPEPTKLNGQRVIGVSRIGDKAKERLPGMPHERAAFGERWLHTPPLKENALAVEVQKEATFYDLTGDVLNVANSVGLELGYRKELRQIDYFIGVTQGSPTGYKYKDTFYNTYLATDPAPAGQWVNDFSNELLDYTAVENVLLKFSRMTDAETGKRILANFDKVLVMPGKLFTAQQILGAAEVQRRRPTTGDPQVISQAPNPVKGMNLSILSSPLIEQRATDADGLALSLANATKYWWAWDSKAKPFRYMQAWPLTTAQAPTNTADMLDRGIVAAYFANERGEPSVWEPRFVVRSKN